MLYYLKKYPLSLLILAAVVYLSFFRPPSLEIVKVMGMDKIVHICMYSVLSGVLWFEYLRNHRCGTITWHVWVGAVVCPILMSGVIELLQQYCTIYRSGDWFDFLANTSGVTLATLIAWYVIRPRVRGKNTLK